MGPFENTHGVFQLVYIWTKSGWFTWLCCYSEKWPMERQTVLGLNPIHLWEREYTLLIIAYNTKAVEICIVMICSSEYTIIQIWGEGVRGHFFLNYHGLPQCTFTRFLLHVWIKKSVLHLMFVLICQLEMCILSQVHKK